MIPLHSLVRALVKATLSTLTIDGYHTVLLVAALAASNHIDRRAMHALLILYLLGLMSLLLNYTVATNLFVTFTDLITA